MKVIVQEKVNAIVTPEEKVFHVVVDSISRHNAIPGSIGLMKGDMIVFRGEGDPVRFASGNSAGKVMLTDPTSPVGWVLGNPSEGAVVVATLHNNTGEFIHTGTVVKIDSGEDFIKASASDDDNLFITAEDCNEDDTVDCYGITNSVCLILCTADAVSIGDVLTISSTDGLCKTSISSTDRIIAIALSDKASGSAGTVKALLTGVILTKKDIMYFDTQAVSTGTNSEILRIEDASITTDTVVLECTFANPLNITDNVTWASYNGYISFIGSCSTATTANVTLATKGN